MGDFFVRQRHIIDHFDEDLPHLLKGGAKFHQEFLRASGPAIFQGIDILFKDGDELSVVRETAYEPEESRHEGGTPGKGVDGSPDEAEDDHPIGCRRAIVMQRWDFIGYRCFLSGQGDNDGFGSLSVLRYHPQRDAQQQQAQDEEKMFVGYGGQHGIVLSIDSWSVSIVQ